MEGCQGCTRRSVEPNCHNVKTCAYWAKHMAEREKEYAKRELEQQASRPSSRYKKNGNGKGSIYIRGEKATRTPRGRTVVKGGTK